MNFVLKNSPTDFHGLLEKFVSTNINSLSLYNFVRISLHMLFGKIKII